MRQFLLPDLGEGLEEAEIVAWHVTEGDHVVADQPLVSVETDKAVVEVPSPQSGRVARLFGVKGDVVKVGTPLVEFAEAPEADTGTVVGELAREERNRAAPQPTTGQEHAKSVQILPAEPCGVHVDLLKYVQHEVARNRGLILHIVARRRRDAAGQRIAPGLPPRSREPGAIEHE